MTINRSTGIVSGIRQENSPNVGAQLVPDSIVIHYTAQTSTEGAIRSLRDPSRKVSAHFVLGRDGELVQMVPLNKQAWHAGRSSYNGRIGYNKYSIGIEIVNAGPLTQSKDNKYRTWYKSVIPDDQVEHDSGRSPVVPATDNYWHSYAKEQIDKCWEICDLLIQVYGIKEVVGHEEISPRRKIDPGPAFPLDTFRNRLFGHRDEDDTAEIDIEPQDIQCTVEVPVGETLNLRTSSNPTAPVLAELAKGAEVKVLDEQGRWTKVSVEGYVAGRYLR